MCLNWYLSNEHIELHIDDKSCHVNKFTKIVYITALKKLSTYSLGNCSIYFRRLVLSTKICSLLLSSSSYSFGEILQIKFKWSGISLTIVLWQKYWCSVFSKISLGVTNAKIVKLSQQTVTLNEFVLQQRN